MEELSSHSFEHIYSKNRITEFLQKYESQLCKNFVPENVCCGIIKLEEMAIAGIKESLTFSLAELIRRGELVAFPTETVYGLGANALDAQAVQSIFATKRRPLTDPVIVHLANPADINGYVEDSANIELGQQFWPGPFTLVLKYKNYDKTPELMRRVSKQRNYYRPARDMLVSAFPTTQQHLR